MKKLLLLTFIFLTVKIGFSQTAVDFTASDCSNTPHNLFTELNAGKIIVLVWVMPCGTCISDAKAGYDAAQSFASTNPGRVVYWLVDDFGNSTCSTLSSWANTNGILTSNITVFGNAGNLIDENNYGGSAMPHVLVLGGMNHKVYYNKRSGSNDGLAIAQAITQAITTGVSQKVANENPVKVYPNPAKNKLILDCSSNTSSVNMFEIYNIVGEKIQTIIPENEFMNRGLIEINLPVNLPKGNYLIMMRSDEKCQSLRFTVVE